MNLFDVVHQVSDVDLMQAFVGSRQRLGIDAVRRHNRAPTKRAADATSFASLAAGDGTVELSRRLSPGSGVSAVNTPIIAHIPY